MTNKNYAELGELCRKLTGHPFEVLAFPCNQFGAQESGTNDGIRLFVTGKLAPFGVDFTVFEKVHVNGKATHPVYHWLRYNAKETRRRKKCLPIPWNFAKFLVDKQGRVYKYFGPTKGPLEIEPSVQELLADFQQGEPPQPPTIAAHTAPPGFAPYRPSLR